MQLITFAVVAYIAVDFVLPLVQRGIGEARGIVGFQGETDGRWY
jgi:hypothetical protein